MTAKRFTVLAPVVLIFALLLIVMGNGNAAPPMLSSPPIDCGKGHLFGVQLQPRDLAQLAAEAGFTGANDLVTAVAVDLAESQGFDRAYHDNCDSNGNLTSRDVGVAQINITASAVGTSTEEALYDPATNLSAAHELFSRRGFQPWVAYTSTVYLFDSYLKRATRGVGNYMAERFLALPATKLDGSPYEHALTTPVLDYEYRVIRAYNADVKIRDELTQAIRERNWTLVQQARTDAANATLIPKQ